mgnify:CR=1 FL=1
MTKKKELKKTTLVDAIKDTIKDIDPSINTITVENVEIDSLGKAPEANIDVIVGQEYSNIVFKNVTFRVDDIIRISDNHYIRFEDCTFNKYINLYCHDCSFNNCKVNYTLDIDSSSGNVTLTNCIFDTFDLDISGTSIIQLFRCKNICELNIECNVHDILIEDCTGKFWNISRCNIGTLKLNNCKFTAGNVRESRITYIAITGNYEKELKLDALTIVNSIITNLLRLTHVTVKKFTAYKTAMFAAFKYDKDAIKDWDLHYTTGIIPPQNTTILYKKAYVVKDDRFNEMIVKLEVPEKAKRVYCDELKIRVSEAKVIGFYNIDGSALPDNIEVVSNYDHNFKYKIGETVKPEKDFDPTSGVCGSGIHGYIDIGDAFRY